MDFVNLPLLVAATLLFASMLAGLLTARFGLSFLLVFLLAGILAGEDGPGGIHFDDHRLSFWVGNVALAVILLDGGLRTAYATFRTGLRPALLLATLGVLACAGIVAAAAVAIVGLDWGSALLLGAIVGSTDAAAVFSMLNRSGVRLNERVAATLEIESGMNDPMAVYLTLAMIAVLARGPFGAPGAATGGEADLAGLLLAFVQQFGWGATFGVAGGWAMAALARRLADPDALGAVFALLIGAAGLAVFAACGLAGGSGFLAVYLFGLVLAHRAPQAVRPVLAAMDGYAWLAQAGMFLLLGLLVTPSSIGASIGPALAIAGVLIVVARPLAVALCLVPMRFPPREIAFIAWVGLRGAVPIVLALFPLLAATPQAALLFNIAFVVVLSSLLVQGASLAWVARRLGVSLPDVEDEPGMRAVFHDFVLDGSAPLSEVCRFYGLPLPSDAGASAPEGGEPSLGHWMAHALRRAPVEGDTLALGRLQLVVRDMRDGRIWRVGVGLPP